MANGIITLNVGGLLYTAKRGTLERAPFIESFLRNSESFEKTSFEGNLFIDRDGQAFKDILAFLRSGLPVVATVPAEILQQEADFYGIEDFQTLSVNKKLFLPESTKHEDTIRCHFHDLNRQGQRRFRCIGPVPAGVPTQAGSGGVPGCVTEEALVGLGFRWVEALQAAGADSQSVPESGASSGDEEIVFQRTVITHYVDLQHYSVPDDDSTPFDKVETREYKGQRFAVVTKYR